LSLSWGEFNNRLISNAKEHGIPVTGTFELTSRCNFSCRMCYVCSTSNAKKASGEELSAGQWLQLGREARDSGLVFLTLTGGEVFLRNDFMEIYEGLAEMGFNITIFSNASLVTYEKARWLARIPPSKFSSTLYGASNETYEKITGCKDGFYRTIRGLDYLNSFGIDVEVKTTVVEGNYREFDKLVKISDRYGKGLGIVNYISPRRTAGDTDPVGNRLPPEILAKYEEYVEEFNMRRFRESMGSEVELDHDTMLEQTALSRKKRLANSRSESAFHCLAGKCGFWITASGHMTPCGLLEIPFSEPVRAGFLEAWRTLQVECAKVPKCSECSECSMRDSCMTCPARLMTETGQFDKPASYLCALAENRTALQKSRRAKLIEAEA
jgi:MoaA/NifB/PqqE/SkfB family radical SAM enzyme